MIQFPSISLEPFAWFGLCLLVVLVIILALGVLRFAHHTLSSLRSAGPELRGRITQPMRIPLPLGNGTPLPSGTGDLATGVWTGTIPAAELSSNTVAMLGPVVIPGKQAPLTLYSLEVIEGPFTGHQFPILDLPAVIGRGSFAMLRLDEDLGVSRRHAELFERNGSLFVRDLHSTHGTWVNDQPVQEASLLPGDQVKIGSTVMLVRYSGR